VDGPVDRHGVGDVEAIGQGRQGGLDDGSHELVAGQVEFVE
jgi:hypothetical protein